MTLPYRFLALTSLALAAAILGYGHYKYREGEQQATATYEAALNKQRAEAATKLATETQRVADTERKLQDALRNQEIQDAKNKTIVVQYQTDLALLAGVSGRLRDPNATSGRGCGGPDRTTATDAGGGAADRAEAGGLLSGHLTELLLRLTAEADEVNMAYASCRADSVNIRRR